MPKTHLERPIGAQALEVFSFEELRDFRDWADLVTVATVVEEVERMPDREQVATGEYIISRRLRLAIEGRPLWARGDFDVSEVDIGSLGWMQSVEHGRRELMVAGGPRMRAGETFIVALIRQPDGSWSLLCKAAALQLDDGGRVARVVGMTPVQAQQVGKTADTLRDELSRLPPDPAIEKYAAYAPYDRGTLVADEVHHIPDVSIDDYTPTTIG